MTPAEVTDVLVSLGTLSGGLVGALCAAFLVSRIFTGRR